MSAAGPPQGARPPGGERRPAPLGGEHGAAGPPEHALAHGFARHVVRWAREGGAPGHALSILHAAAYAASLATAAGHVCVNLADVVELVDGFAPEAARDAHGLAMQGDGDAGDPEAHGLALDRDAGGIPLDPDAIVIDDDTGAPDGAAAVRAGDDHVPGGAKPITMEAARGALLASGMVGTPGSPGALPLILDADGRLYLHRYFDYERRLAKRLQDAARTAPVDPGPEVHSLLAALFADNAKLLQGRTDWQRIATALALTRRLTLVSGGPGTGKTTTVVKLLACALTLNPDLRVALAAPTGKAAARMLEAVRGAMAELSPELRGRLPAESFTVHRLLGVLPDSREFRHHAGNPLAVDLLVVDEASMLDLALATRLLEATPPAAHIVLLGDKDQLAAVESGAVFSELAADPTLSRPCVDTISAMTGIPAARIDCAPPIHPTGLTDSVVWLAESFRFAPKGGIGRLAASVNAGRAVDAIELLRSAHDGVVHWIQDGRPVPQAETLNRILRAMASYLDALQAGLADPAALFRALSRFRVLCAERDGPRGAADINRLVSDHVRRRLDHPLDPGSRSDWYPGRPVMVLRNDYVLKLFNGDIGVVLPDGSERLAVVFPQNDGGFRAIAPPRLPEHETAYATTVHKAQGSEFEEVLVLLPSAPIRVVTRELLYTAITRARSSVTVVGAPEVLEKAVATPTRRHSGLVARLRGRE